MQQIGGHGRGCPSCYPWFIGYNSKNPEDWKSSLFVLKR